MPELFRLKNYCAAKLNVFENVFVKSNFTHIFELAAQMHASKSGKTG